MTVCVAEVYSLRNVRQIWLPFFLKIERYLGAKGFSCVIYITALHTVLHQVPIVQSSRNS